MAAESSFVAIAHAVADEILTLPFRVVRGAPLLYEIRVSNALEVMGQNQVRKPKRGTSAFQTDLCVFEDKTPDIAIPRVVIEFKTGITTHDVLTYSAKALKHRQIYPYLRYGVLASSEKSIPGRVFTHNEGNEGIDFFAAVAELQETEFKSFFASLLQAEIESSNRLESIAFGTVKTRLFRTEVQLNQNAR
jgi:hypothetical protein